MEPRPQRGPSAPALFYGARNTCFYGRGGRVARRANGNIVIIIYLHTNQTERLGALIMRPTSERSATQPPHMHASTHASLARYHNAHININTNTRRAAFEYD